MAANRNEGASFLATAVETIHRHWADLSGRLDPAAREELWEILAEAEGDPVAAARDLRELIKPFAPPGHPAREALTPPGVRFRPGAAAPPDPHLLPLLLALRTDVLTTPGHSPAALAGAAARPGTDGPHDTGDAAPPPPEEATPYRPDADDAWLLAEPAVPAASVDLAADQTHDLILLTDENDVELIPTFQFDPGSGAPYPVVIEINRLLSAEEDPWGAADWWLGSNVWLDAPPARLLGTGADDALRSAAWAETPEW
ncbi:hypothetical protein ACO0M4_16955 [Streptomyces sp. RGM 3693]|uniref:hypothetical protein n=1 Tax=Streptomyces sp. RGM 3693 TaxID=3413284 RepID=UPI003D2E7B7B